MNRKKLLIRALALILVIINMFQLVSCGFDSYYSSSYYGNGYGDYESSEDDENWWDDVGSWWDDKSSEVDSWWDDKSSEVGSWWDDTSDNVGDWWDTTTDSVGTWWGGASENMGIWWENAVSSGADLYDAANRKFHESVDVVSNKSKEIIDKVVTNVATSMHENSQKELSGSIGVSDKKLTNVETMSDDSSEYDYDVAAFVYKLISAMFPENYEVFPAIIYNQDEETIVGIAYTDFGLVYQGEDGKNYYATGFISLDGEFLVAEEDLNAGLEIYRADGDVDENSTFFLAYLPSNFMTHCVIFEQYLTFGVEKYQITYEIIDYDPSVVETSYGQLYSFDSNSILFEELEPSYLTDSPFMAKVKYATRSIEEIKADIYEYMEDMKIDFSSINIKETFNTAKENVVAIFDKLGKENGIKDLTINDLIGVDMFSKKEAANATEQEKMILGTAMVIAVVTTIVINVVLIKASPKLAAKLVPVVGAIIGAAIEAFVETVLNDTAVADLDYRKIALAAVSGAISAKMGLVGDAIVGGLTDGVFAMIDGESFDEVIKSIYLGSMAGLTLGITLHGVSKLFGAIGNKVSKKIVGEVSAQLGDAVTTPKTVTVAKNTVVLLENSDNLGAKYAAGRAAREAIEESDEIAESLASQYAKKAYKALPSVKNNCFKYVDVNGTYANNKVLNGWIEITDEAPEVLKKSLTTPDGRILNKIEIRNGRLIVDDVSYFSPKIENFSRWRNTNFNRADDITAKAWSDNPDLIPQKCRKYFDDNGIDFYDLNKTKIAKMREELGLTWHEDVDMQTIHLVSKAWHNVNKGGISHIGGIAMAKLAKSFNVEANTALSYIGKYYYTVA